MAAPTVLGSTVLIGFPSGEELSGVIRDSYDKETTADIEHIRDEDNVEVAALVSNPGKRITLDGVCTTGQESILKGGTVTINSVVYLVEAATVRHTKLATRFSLTCYKPDGATYSSGA
jgi:hypothetical protein